MAEKNSYLSGSSKNGHITADCKNIKLSASSTSTNTLKNAVFIDVTNSPVEYKKVANTTVKRSLSKKGQSPYTFKSEKPSLDNGDKSSGLTRTSSVRGTSKIGTLTARGPVNIIAKNNHLFHRPGAVFDEVATTKESAKENEVVVSTPNIRQSNFQGIAHTTKIPTSLSKSSSLLISSSSTPQTPNVVCKSLPKSSASSSVTHFNKTAKVTPSESASRRASVKRSVTDFKSRLSADSCQVKRTTSTNVAQNGAHSTPVHTSTENGAHSTPIRKSTENSFLRVRSSLKMLHGARNSPSHFMNSPAVTTSSIPTMSGNNQQTPHQGTSTPGSERRNTQGYDPLLTDFNFGLYHINQREAELSNVSVCVRVRPINSREAENPAVKNILHTSGNEIFLNAENGNAYTFSYERCFWSCDDHHNNFATQEVVYNSMAQPLLDHAYEGYNVCLFAYGQTGSGKSYCIMGEEAEISACENVSEDAGIVPRFCKELFQRASEIHAKNETQAVQRHIVVEISYIEIYNEKIYDLVGCQCLQQGEVDEKNSNCHNHVGERKEALKVREHPVTGPYVEGASKHLVSTFENLQTWLSLGNKQRSISSTGMNEKSSRSHAVFTINVTQSSAETIEGEVVENELTSKINLVDLAGSERVAASISEGDRLKEGVCINKSLLTLGKVINALAESPGKKVFVPYRESTLTWLLKESLGGNSKTTMIATVSPCNIHQEETLSTLRFAQKTRKITNWNHINEHPTSKVIRALQLEVERLRAQKLNSSIHGASIEGANRCEDTECNGRQSCEFGNETELRDNRDREELESEQYSAAVQAKEYEIEILRHNLKMTQEQYSQKERLWKEKLHQSEKRREEALERCKMQGLTFKLEDNQPVLVNLCEDPQLSETLLYSLKQGATTFGQTNSDVTLSALRDKDIHCTVLYEGEKLMLYPTKFTETFVNGALVTEATEVYHDDRISLSGIYFFRICYPSVSKRPQQNAKKVDYYFARDELLKAQEERLRAELMQQQETARFEMLREMEEQKTQLMQEKMTLNDRVNMLASQLEADHKHLRNAELTQIELQEEKQFLEDHVRHLQSLNVLTSNTDSPTLNDGHFFDEVEAIFNESTQTLECSVLHVTSEDVETRFMVQDSNKICKIMKKPYEFQQQSRLADQGIEAVILVNDNEHNLTAFITVNQFKNILSILRDILLGAQEDDGIFETSINWERREEMSKLPGVINKLKMSAKRLSVGSSFSSPLHGTSIIGPPPPIRKTEAPRRRSYLNQSFSKNSSLSVPPRNPCNGKCCAKALSQMLLNISDSVAHMPPLTDVIAKLISFQKDIKELVQHTQRHSASIVEDDISMELVKASVSATALLYSVINIASLSLVKDSKPDSDLQLETESLGIRIMRKVARIMQGVDKEVDSLIEEEGLAVLNLLEELIEKIGFLSVCHDNSLPEVSSQLAGSNLWKNYLTGVSRGVEWQVKSASRLSQTVASYLSSSDAVIRHEHAHTVTKFALQSMMNIAIFLDHFSHLKVDANVTFCSDKEPTTDELSRFFVRVSAASDNIHQLTLALTTIRERWKTLNEEVVDHCLISATVSLKESLVVLVKDAGVGISDRKYKNQSFSSFTSTSENDNSIEIFMDNLRTSSRQMLNTVKALLLSLHDYRVPEAEAKNLSAKSLPLRSAFKSDDRCSTEKKVRFDINLEATVLEESSEDNEDSYEEIDTVDV